MASPHHRHAVEGEELEEPELLPLKSFWPSFPAAMRAAIVNGSMFILPWIRCRSQEQASSDRPTAEGGFARGTGNASGVNRCVETDVDHGRKRL